MWRFDVAGTELHDARARLWSPAMGTFLSVDEYDFHSSRTTLWSWSNQNPLTFSDPSGRDGTTSNPIQDLVDSGFLPPGLTLFGKGERMRNSGIAMMANDATFEAGQAKMNCGNAIIGASAGVLAADAQVLVGAAQGLAMAIKGGGNAIAVRSGGSNLVKSGDLTLVSRWGREGLQSGDWVMKGEANWSTTSCPASLIPDPGTSSRLSRRAPSILFRAARSTGLLAGKSSRGCLVRESISHERHPSLARARGRGRCFPR